MAIAQSKDPNGLDRGDFRDANKRFAFLEVTPAGTLLVGLVAQTPIELTQAQAGDVGTLLSNFSSTGSFTPPP
jgi:hypothetical protein